MRFEPVTLAHTAEKKSTSRRVPRKKTTPGHRIATLVSPPKLKLLTIERLVKTRHRKPSESNWICRSVSVEEVEKQT